MRVFQTLTNPERVTVVEKVVLLLDVFNSNRIKIGLELIRLYGAVLTASLTKSIVRFRLLQVLTTRAGTLIRVAIPEAPTPPLRILLTVVIDLGGSLLLFTHLLLT